MTLSKQDIPTYVSSNSSFVQLFHFRCNFHGDGWYETTQNNRHSSGSPALAQYYTNLLLNELILLKCKDLTCFTPSPPYSRHPSCSSANPRCAFPPGNRDNARKRRFSHNTPSVTSSNPLNVPQTGYLQQSATAPVGRWVSLRL